MNPITTGGDAHITTPQQGQSPTSTRVGRGAFISFEGIDGAGKSTHIAAASALVTAQGLAVLQSREPGGTPLSEQLRQLVLHERMDAVTESLLVFAARREHVVQRIAPALAAGQWVLCDRFTDASFAYQGGGRGMDWQMLEQLEQYAQQSEAGLIAPDLTLWFDVPPAVAAKRLQAARAPDKFESQQEAFFDRVRSGYLRRQQAQSKRMVRIDADQTPDTVWQAVEMALISFVEQWREHPQPSSPLGAV